MESRKQYEDIMWLEYKLAGLKEERERFQMVLRNEKNDPDDLYYSIISSLLERNQNLKEVFITHYKLISNPYNFIEEQAENNLGVITDNRIMRFQGIIWCLHDNFARHINNSSTFESYNDYLHGDDNSLFKLLECDFEALSDWREWPFFKFFGVNNLADAAKLSKGVDYVVTPDIKDELLKLITENIKIVSRYIKVYKRELYQIQDKRTYLPDLKVRADELSTLIAETEEAIRNLNLDLHYAAFEDETPVAAANKVK